jgi:signal transduction histidine kinase
VACASSPSTNALSPARYVIGIRDDEIPQLFNRFFRAESPRSHSISGTGLGLAIAKSIADAHHGSIEVDSKLGEGTTMRLRLPLKSNGDDG